MLVIISVSRLDSDKFTIQASRPQHDSNALLEYSSANEVRMVLSTLGMTEETIDSHLKLLAQMGTNEHLKFPPTDVPRQALLDEGFRL